MDGVRDDQCISCVALKSEVSGRSAGSKRPASSHLKFQEGSWGSGGGWFNEIGGRIKNQTSEILNRDFIDSGLYSGMDTCPLRLFPKCSTKIGKLGDTLELLTSQFLDILTRFGPKCRNQY